MSKKKKQAVPARLEARMASAGLEPRPGTTPVVTSFREPPEPRAEERNLPIWLIVLLFPMLFWADIYIMNHGADVQGQAGAFPTVVYDPFTSYQNLVDANPVSPEEAARSKGRGVFNFVCIACHQANGQGLPGQYPPLAGSEWVQHADPERIIRIVLNGLTGQLSVKGQTFNNTMPPWKTTLTDEQIAHVLSYVRGQWGNNAPPVPVDEVKKVRDAIKSREAPFTPAELENLSAKTP